ncbi:MAG: CBS domain-containing protein [Winogradskyella sp.]|uniref:DUF294 nucleotidyltransferase-like domain-containing protein n=1 Tax=Winogradskyella sp. TaxID=1883156 RepID=UPI0017F88A83|nr:DUF294 nucleotidyltransferase-like domain-containing protein [Winogradskyella sp.]MBT8246132.1 CBS domain-containing protein [Winogradskyella sp.]NNK22667.1 CBS domain-containing protein [Winogradskyella sp.]
MNTIAIRIFDFLKNFPPFEALSKEQLLSVCESVNVIYVEKEVPVFNIGEPINNHFYVVKDGAVGLFRDNNLLVDECDEGDIFGLRALLRKGDYILSAKAIEETILYTISSELLESHITPNANASQFLMTSFVSNIRHGNSSSITKNISSPRHDISDLQSADYSKNPITCTSDTSIKDAAQIMTNNRVGSIVVSKNNKPLGIITDKDLRTKIATGHFNISDSVSKIMSSPVITYPENISVAEAQIAMLRHRITHLCITKDGTVNTELTGILSEHDIIVLRENNASVLIKEIKRSNKPEHLKNIRQRAEQLLERYLDQNIPINFSCRLISTINDAITTRLINLAIDKLKKKSPVKFAWLAIGSQGRQEQLLLTDQDNALVFEDVSKENNETVKDYFLALSNEVNHNLETVGFELCPAKMMANNPKWCLSVSEWQSQFNRWVSKPDQDNLMLCTIFFDYELVYGDSSLVNQLSKGIFNSISKHDIFLTYLARNTLQNPPPLSFFRQFLVENDGEHKDQFDIKARAIMPLVDAARLLILSHNIKSVNNTIQRFIKLIELEPQNKDVYLFCIEAFKDLLEFRTSQGLTNNNSGRFIDLQSLSKGNRLKLKRSFKSVKAIQELIQTRFKLSQLL